MITTFELGILRNLWIRNMPTTLIEITRDTGEQPADITAALEDMAGRGMIAPDEGGYRPLLTSPQYCAAQIRQLVDQLYSGDALAFLKDYIGTASPEDRAALEDAINKGDRQS